MSYDTDTRDMDAAQITCYEMGVAAGKAAQPKVEPMTEPTKEPRIDCPHCGTTWESCKQWKADGKVACCPDCQHRPPLDPTKEPSVTAPTPGGLRHSARWHREHQQFETAFVFDLAAEALDRKNATCRTCREPKGLSTDTAICAVLYALRCEGVVVINGAGNVTTAKTARPFGCSLWKEKP